MTDEELNAIQGLAPAGAFKLSTDAQGRITLPTAWITYWEGKLGDTEYFITREKGWLKIFPKSLWAKQDALAYQEKSEEDYENWSIAMQHYGNVTRKDDGNRVTPSQALRTAMNLKSNELVMINHRGTLRGMLKTDYDARVTGAEEQASKQIPRPEGPRML